MNPPLPRRRSLVLPLALATLALLAAGAEKPAGDKPGGEAAAAAAQDKWVKLFQEEGPPKGWVVRVWSDVSKPGPEGAAWIVKDGVLHGSEPRGTWLVSEKEYGDFVLEYEFKLGERGNSGCGLRFPPTGDPAFDGLELQMADERYNEGRDGPDKLTGSLYKALAPRKQVYKPTEWNKYVITLKGASVKVELNGELIQDVNLDQHTAKIERHDGRPAPSLKDRPRKGRIGFQELSRGGAHVLIRNARIKELGGGAAAPGEKGADARQTVQAFLAAGPPRKATGNDGCVTASFYEILFKAHQLTRLVADDDHALALAELPDLPAGNLEGPMVITLSRRGGKWTVDESHSAETPEKAQDEVKQFQQKRPTSKLVFEAPRNDRDARQTAEAFLEAAVNGKTKEAAALGEPGKFVSREESVREDFALLRLRDTELPLTKLFADDNNALAVTGVVAVPSERLVGPLVLKLVRKDGRWIVSDAGLESDHGAQREVEAFQLRVPGSRLVFEQEYEKDKGL
jgi:hypothetical protein